MESTAPVLNDSQWVRMPAMTCFMEHDRLSRDGKLLERVDCIRLEEIARQMNKRDARGQLCPITPGHTDDDAPEHEQPPHWGYARNWKAEWDAKKSKWVLKADWYIRRDKYEAARTFPNVSPEYWHQDGLLDPISLLRRTPKLDLGQWIYTRQGKVCRYAMESDMAEDRSAPEDKGGHKASSDPAETGDPPAHTGRTGSPPQSNEADGPEGVHPQFHENFKKSMEHHYRTGEHHRYMLQYPHHPVHNAMGGGGGMGMPGPTSGMLPPHVPGGVTTPPGGETVSRMQKNQDAIEKTTYQREVEELRGQVQQLRQQALDNAHERDFYALLGQGYHLSVEKEVKKTARLDGAAYQEYLADVKENYRRTAGHKGDALINTVNPNFPGTASKGAGDEEAFSRDDLEVAEQYMREQRTLKGVDPSWEACEKFAREHRNGK